MIASLYSYNDWANARLFQLAQGLDDSQLDSQREMGFGSLRATMFHIWAAEHLWLQRWMRVPQPTFSIDPQGMPMDEIARNLREVSARRWEWIQSEGGNSWLSLLDYKDLRGNQHSNRLIDLMLHVANHGVHHRAQALHFLKHHDRKAAGGIDYLSYRIAYPSTPLIPELIEPMRQFGLEVATGEGDQVALNKPLLQDFYRYHDWAIGQLVPMLEELDSDSLHRPMNMGVGSMHQTLAHLRDAERWWLGLWNGSDERFARYDATENLRDIAASWRPIIEARNSIVEGLDQDSASRVVVANPGKLKIPSRVLESMIQLCCHGTHHRAQLVNMLRQVGVQAPAIDVIVWLRSRTS